MATKLTLAYLAAQLEAANNRIAILEDAEQKRQSKAVELHAPAAPFDAFAGVNWKIEYVKYRYATGQQPAPEAVKAWVLAGRPEYAPA